jgi:integrase
MAVFVVRTERRPGVVRHVVRWQAGHYSKQVHLGSFKTTTEANLRREWAEREIAAGRIPDPKTIGRADKPVYLGAAFAAFLEARRADAAANTLNTLRQRSVPIVERLGHLTLEQVTPAVIQAFILERVDEGDANRTVRHRISALRQVLDHAGVDPNPVDARVVRKPPNRGKRIVVPTPAEEKRVLAALNPEYRAVVEWIKATGMRISEAVAVTYGDIDHEHQAVRVLESKTMSGERWIKNEPDAPFTIPDQPDGVEDWRRVFPVASAAAVQSGLARACANTGTRRLGPHAWRHLHASTCLRNGMDVVRVAARLGHSDPSITLGTYAHLLPPR